MRLELVAGLIGLIQILWVGLTAAQVSRFRSFGGQPRRTWSSAVSRTNQPVPRQRFPIQTPYTGFQTYKNSEFDNDFPRLSMPSRRQNLRQLSPMTSFHRPQRTRTWQTSSQRQSNYVPGRSSSFRRQPGNVRIRGSSQRSFSPSRAGENEFESSPTIQRRMFMERRPTTFRLQNRHVQSREQSFRNVGRTSPKVTSRQFQSIVSGSRSVPRHELPNVSKESTRQRMSSHVEPHKTPHTTKANLNRISVQSPHFTSGKQGKQTPVTIKRLQTSRFGGQPTREFKQSAVVQTPQEAAVKTVPGTHAQTGPVIAGSRHAQISHYLPQPKLATSSVSNGVDTKATQHHVVSAQEVAAPKPSSIATDKHLPYQPVHHGTSITGLHPATVHTIKDNPPIVYNNEPLPAVAHTHKTAKHVPVHAAQQPVSVYVAKQPVPVNVGKQPAHVYAAQQPAPVHTAQQPVTVHAAQQPAPVHVAQQHVPVHVAKQPAPVYVAQQHTPVYAAEQTAPIVKAQSPVASQTHTTAVHQSSLLHGVIGSLSKTSAQAHLPLSTQQQQQPLVPKHAPSHAQVGSASIAHTQGHIPVDTQPHQSIVPHSAPVHSIVGTSPIAHATLPVATQQHQVMSQPSAPVVDPTKTLHDELVAALVAVLEGKVSPASASAGVASMASMPAQSPVHTQPQVHTPIQAHSAINPYLSQVSQFGFGSNMYMPQSMHGLYQPMYPAHMYPAHMQELMFGDTQDPPDPTVATPNVTTAVPESTTPVPVTDPVTFSNPPETTTELIQTEFSTPDPLLTSTEASPSTTDVDPHAYDIIPVTTEIPLPHERKYVKKAHAGSATKTKEDKIRAIAKAVKGLKGKMDSQTRQKLLSGIKRIVTNSKVDLSSLKASLSKHLSAMKVKPPAREYASPDQITDPPSHMHKTTLPPPGPHVTRYTRPPRSAATIGKTTKQHLYPTAEVTNQNSLNIRSLVDTGSSSGSATLQAILKEIASQSNGKKTIPHELKNVNFAEIARSLTPKGTDLATQLADPNFVKLLKEIVSKLNTFAHAQPMPYATEMTSMTPFYTTTEVYEA